MCVLDFFSKMFFIEGGMKFTELLQKCLAAAIDLDAAVTNSLTTAATF